MTKRILYFLMTALLCGAYAMLAGCNKKADTPIVVEPAKPEPAKVEVKPDQGKSTKVASPEEQGMVKIEVNTDDPTAMVLIDGNEFSVRELNQAIPLPAGEHILVLKVGGTEVTSRRFMIDKGKRKVLQLGEPNRAAAEWVLGIGGRVQILVDGKVLDVEKPADLPKAPFKVLHFNSAGKRVSDDDLEVLEGLTQLNTLWIPDSQVTTSGLVHVRGLTELVEINLNRTKVTDAALLHLKSLPKLDKFHLERTPITDAGLAHLAGINVALLSIGHTAVTDAGLKHLTGMRKLWLLHAYDTKITDEGLAHLRSLTNLGDLNLARTQVTDAGLEQLKELKNLRVVGLTGTAVTDAGIAALKKALPKCNVGK